MIMCQLDDLNQNFTFNSNTFDLINSRLVGGGINATRWEPYIRDMKRCYSTLGKPRWTHQLTSSIECSDRVAGYKWLSVISCVNQTMEVSRTNMHCVSGAVNTLAPWADSKTSGHLWDFTRCSRLPALWALRVKWYLYLFVAGRAVCYCQHVAAGLRCWRQWLMTGLVCRWSTAKNWQCQ